MTPEDVLRLPMATSGFLCSPKDNVFGIDFTRFKIRDMDSGTVLFEIAKPKPAVRQIIRSGIKTLLSVETII